MVCSHVANGAKHFELDDQRHKSVSETEATDGAFDPAIFNQDIFDVPRLTIHYRYEKHLAKDHPVEISTLISMLSDAGFESAGCFWRYLNFAIISARKTASVVFVPS